MAKIVKFPGAPRSPEILFREVEQEVLPEARKLVVLAEDEEGDWSLSCSEMGLGDLLFALKEAEMILEDMIRGDLPTVS